MNRSLGHDKNWFNSMRSKESEDLKKVTCPDFNLAIKQNSRSLNIHNLTMSSKPVISGKGIVEKPRDTYQQEEVF